MAKALLFLQTGDAERLADVLQQSLEGVFAKTQHCTLQLMRAHPKDAFAVLPPDYERPQLIIELCAAPGLPVADLCAPLEAALSAGAPSALITPDSAVCTMQELRVIDCATQPVHYHYLMQRRPEFTPADYNDYYTNFHVRMGRNTPAISGYRQNLVDGVGSALLARRLGLAVCAAASISELLMPSLEELARAPGLAAIAEPAAQDEARFVDRPRSASFSSQVIWRYGDFARIREPVFEQHFPAN